ncbi:MULTISPECIES: phytoene desaturase [Sphingomonadaceae]|uniref:phytoene desaturase n=1 Tax=Sphingomonadaceae TaxID=41297 RepID=UPI0011574210|nr:MULTISPECIES: phytoene desaturase [Sphingomonadaceae]QDK33648.1 phytoene desaturase [Sphingomonas sp. IC081]QSR17652.1 phytoene dehydrogenase [Novosphingobium sp. KA1]
MKKACIIGAGFGGLALAIRLQAAGIETTLVEAREMVGGRAGVWQREGFTFDAGPTVITDPNSLRDLWTLTGHDIADDIELMPVMPFYRLNWTDGVTFDYSNDDAALRREITRVAPQDIGGYEEFLRYAEGVYQEGYVRLGDEAFLDFSSMVKAAPALARYQAWRSVYSMVSHFVKDEHLRQALSFHTLLVGGNPMTTSAIYALIHKLEKDGGVWWARGGTNKLAQAMARQFERIGGTVRLGDKVAAIHTIGDHVSEVECESGWRGRFDAVASNGDIMHSYRDLLAGTARGQDMARKLARKRFTPSVFVVHFGLEGTWPGIPHHSVLFGPRYKGLLEDIFEHGVLPRDFSIYLHHPSVTDPAMAPPGKSTFYALVPVANLGKLPVDWKDVGPLLERRVLAEVSRRLIPDLQDRLVTSFHYAPSDFETDFSAWKGNAFSLEPLLTQSAWLRGHNRDDKLKNFYLVGAGTHPGAGIPGVVASARATARLMVADLK